MERDYLLLAMTAVFAGHVVAENVDGSSRLPTVADREALAKVGAIVCAKRA